MSKGLPYNGWREIVRHGRDKHYYHAQKKKILPQEPVCCCCKCNLPEEVIPYHSEDYGPTLEDYWLSCIQLCNRCHAMIHARFKTPNRWKRLLTQVIAGEIDQEEFPSGRYVAGLLSKFKNRDDTMEYVPMPVAISSYCRDLSLEEYDGASKVATLLVEDLATGQKVEVPDWTIYGENLEMLSKEELDELQRRNINVDEFLSGTIKLPVDKLGRKKYRRLYI